MRSFHTFLICLLLFTLACGSYVEVIDSGSLAYERKQFYKASELFAQEYYAADEGLDRAQKAYFAGMSLEKANLPDKATEWYERAVNDGYGPTALREYAYSLKTNEHYEEASEVFRQLVDQVMDNSRFKQEIRACEMSRVWLIEAESSVVELEEMSMNTSFSEYTGSISTDGKLLFTSDRPRNKNSNDYNWTGNYFTDLYLYDPELETLMPFDQEINQEFNDGAGALSIDMTTLIFTRCGRQDQDLSHCQLYMSRWENGAWATAERLAFQDERYNYGQPSLSDDGELLLFSSNASDAIGGYDLYVSQRNNDGTWSAPNNLGNRINTEYDELTPFFRGDTLYFGSDGHLGMGGLDIFKSFRTEDRQWSVPENLGAPYNSGFDDYGYLIDPMRERSGYLTSNRNTGRGSDDIYAWTIGVPQDVFVQVPDDSTEAADDIVYDYSLSIYVKSPVYADLSDHRSETGEYRGLKNVNILLDDMEVGFTSAKGIYITEGEWDRVYTFSFEKDGFFSQVLSFDPSTIQRDPASPSQVVNLVVEMDRIFEGREITLDNIYYDLDKWDIRDDARPALDQLAELLVRNPNINIELSSHTDCRGEDDYNLVLSQKRAQSVVDYLTSKGISNTRLRPKGYGESKLINGCACTSCTEEEHQINRRTAFAVIGQ